jgi:hypothetical protein
MLWAAALELLTAKFAEARKARKENLFEHDGAEKTLQS